MHGLSLPHLEAVYGVKPRFLVSVDLTLDVFEPLLNTCNLSQLVCNPFYFCKLIIFYIIKYPVIYISLYIIE